MQRFRGSCDHGSLAAVHRRQQVGKRLARARTRFDDGMVILGDRLFHQLSHPPLAGTHFTATQFCDDIVEELVDRHGGQANQRALRVMTLRIDTPSALGRSTAALRAHLGG